MPCTPELSIIIVNWNSAEFVRRCVRSIYANTHRTSFEIIVIDNASYDGCGEMLHTEFPAVHFIQSDANLGFARANNLGFCASLGQILLFLNPDTELVSPAIDTMVEFLHAMPTAGVVGARLLNLDRSIQTTCIQRFPTILNCVINTDVLRRLFPKSPLWGMRPLFEEPAAIVAVEMISGACQMIWRELFERVGCYSTIYFMYAEDADLCLRTYQLALKNYYIGNAVIVHFGGKSSGAIPGNQFSAIMMRRSLHTFFRQHRGRIHAEAYRVIMALSALAHLALLGGATIVTFGLVRRNALFCTMKRWMSVFRWTLGASTTRDCCVT